RLLIFVPLSSSMVVHLRLQNFYGIRTQNPRRPRQDDRTGAHPPLLRPRAGYGDPAPLARRPVRRRPAGRERLLLRRGTQPPHLARRFSEDRGGDEEGDQSEPSVRENRRRAGAGSEGRREGPARRGARRGWPEPIP